MRVLIFGMLVAVGCSAASNDDLFASETGGADLDAGAVVNGSDAEADADTTPVPSGGAGGTGGIPPVSSGGTVPAPTGGSGGFVLTGGSGGLPSGGAPSGGAPAAGGSVATGGQPSGGAAATGGASSGGSGGSGGGENPPGWCEVYFEGGGSLDEGWYTCEEWYGSNPEGRWFCRESEGVPSEPAGTCQECPWDTNNRVLNWRNCDGIGDNGCEAYLLTDPNNCGECGKVCLSGTCVDGRCSP